MSTVYPYLGTPGVMRQLPGANGDPQRVTARGETIHRLLSGAVAKTSVLHPKSSWVLPYTDRPGLGLADLLQSFADGLFDVAGTDLVFVDPQVRNVLGLDASTLGLRSAAALDWIQSAGSVNRGTSGPTGIQTGAVTWFGTSPGATFQPGLVANTANIAKAPVYLPGEPATASLYVSASSASTMSLQLCGYNSAGAVTVTSAATSVAATTTWQRFTVSIAAGAAAFAGCYFILPRLVLGGSVPTNVYVAGAQLEYAAAASAFQRGYGSPRVVIDAQPGRQGPNYGYTTHTLSLSEV